jgi:hypothetical protein
MVAETLFLMHCSQSGMPMLRALSLLTCAIVASCSPVHTVTQVSRSGVGAYETALAIDKAGFAVAWYDVRDGNPEIYMRLLDESGKPSGDEHRLTETPEMSYEPSIERIGDDFAVAWYEQTDDGMQTAMLGKWDRDGKRKWLQTIMSGSRNPVVATDGRAIIAAWIQADSDASEWVWVGTWDAEGRESRSRARIGPASKNTWNVNLAVDRSGVWVVFDAVSSTRVNELFLYRLDSSGVRQMQLTRDDGADSKYPDLKVGARGRMALTWYDMRDGNDEIYLFVGDPSDLAVAIDDRSRRVTRTDAESIGAYLAWNGEEVGLAWSDAASGAHEIFFERFNNTGEPLVSENRITRTGASSLVPAIRPWQKGFALAWTEYQPTSSQVHEGIGEVAFALVD